MKNTSQSYKELGIPYFKEVFDLLDETFKSRGIPYYLLGATAISLELLKDGIKPSRGTKDIDFAIMISSIADYQSLIYELKEKGFINVTDPWTFYHKGYDTAIDILPFGEIEENNTVNFNERNVDFHVLGMSVILSKDKLTTIQIEEKIANIPSLPGMILLKLVAWSDRPEKRENDLGDILLIIKKYYWLMSEFIIDHHYDLFELLNDNELSQRLVASRVLGREAAKYLLLSNHLRDRILLVLENNINAQYQSAIAKDWAVKLDQPMDYTLSLLESLLTGIKEKL
jgi:predicted nucleotidyltransferase